ncbi:MAG: hypothetical protein ACE5IW_12685 [bacterium]
MLTLKTSDTGRMAPNTALSFGASGGALNWSGAGRRGRGSVPCVRGFSVQSILARGSSAFFFYCGHPHAERIFFESASE